MLYIEVFLCHIAESIMFELQELADFAKFILLLNLNEENVLSICSEIYTTYPKFSKLKFTTDITISTSYWFYMLQLCWWLSINYLILLLRSWHSEQVHWCNRVQFWKTEHNNRLFNHISRHCYLGQTALQRSDFDTWMNSEYFLFDISIVDGFTFIGYFCIVSCLFQLIFNLLI